MEGFYIWFGRLFEGLSRAPGPTAVQPHLPSTVVVSLAATVFKRVSSILPPDKLGSGKIFVQYGRV
jgi:hypothetical protein